MPTQIRIRGKRKNPLNPPATAPTSSSLDSHYLQSYQSSSPRQKRRSRRVPAAPKHAPKLDLLPVEILQQIFLYGTNFELPRANARLYHALNAPSIKAKLLAHAFHREWSGSVELGPQPESESAPGFAPDFTPDLTPDLTPETSYLWRQHVAPAFIELGSDVEHHSSLLRQSWVTYEGLRQEQWTHLWTFARQGLRQFLTGEGPAYIESKLTLLESRLRSNFDWGIQSLFYVRGKCRRWDAAFHIDTVKLSGWREAFVLKRDDGKVWRVYLPDVWGFNTICLVRIDQHGPTGGSLPPRKVTLQASVFPYLAPYTELPSKVLHGPWTQVKGHFLDLLLRASAQDILPEAPRGGTGGPPLQDYMDACDGLFDAIKSQCIPAIRRLIGCDYSQEDLEREVLRTAREHGAVILPRHPRTGDDVDEWNNAEDGVAAGHDNSTTLHANGDQLNEYPNLDPSLHLDAKGPWRAINEPCRPDFIQWLHIRPERRHLEAQLRYGTVDELGRFIFRWLARAGTPDEARHTGIRQMLRKVGRECGDDDERLAWLEGLKGEYGGVVDHDNE
jgi:hypothetical protein